MRNSILSTIFLFVSIVTYAQDEIKPTIGWCHERSKAVSEEISQGQFPTFSTRYIDNSGVVLIPVVFHILYNNSAENINESYIASQIERLNTDFRKMNIEVPPYAPWASLQSDIKIEFRLACVDPLGNSTTGIIRKPTSVTQFIYEDQIKFSSTGGDDAWPTSSYFNIWVGDLDDVSGTLGEAAYPEEYNITTNGVPGFLVDGINLDYTVVGANNINSERNLGRVAVHEVGHWLGLDHPNMPLCFQTVPDIPAQGSDLIHQCPTFPYLNDHCNPNYPGVMFMNYMHYTNDQCMYMFTTFQKNKMRSYWDPVSVNPVRFQFIQNYFGIKREPIAPVCSEFIIKLNNPMCLPVNYSFTGPVTEVTHSNSQIVFSVNSGIYNGTVNLIATTGPTNNYIDEYTFQFNALAPEPTFLTPMSEPGTAVQLVKAGVSYICSVLPVQGATYVWSIQGGSIVSGQGSSSMVFIPDEYGDLCPLPNRDTANGNSGETQNNLCHVAINVSAITGTCISDPSQIKFYYELPCGADHCCQPGETTCCSDCSGRNLLVYPNPSSGIFYIETSKSINRPILKAEIINYSGFLQKKYSFVSGQNKVQLNLNGVPKGEYILRIYDGNLWETRKIRIY